MSRISLPLCILTVSLITLMGCTPDKDTPPSVLKRIKSLEAKCVRLEGDFRAAIAARDEYRSDLQSAHRQRDALRAELNEVRQQVAGSNDELKRLNRELTVARAANEKWKGERDAALAQVEATRDQFESFRQMLRVQIDQAEAAFNFTPEEQAAMPLAGL